MLKKSRRIAALALSFILMFSTSILPSAMMETEEPQPVSYAADGGEAFFENLSTVPEGEQIFESPTPGTPCRAKIGNLHGISWGQRDVQVVDASTLDSSMTGKAVVQTLPEQWNSVGYNAVANTKLEKGDIFTISFKYYQGTRKNHHKLSVYLNRLYGDNYVLSDAKFDYRSTMRNGGKEGTDTLLMHLGTTCPFGHPYDWTLGGQGDGFVQYDIIINTCDPAEEGQQTVTFYRGGTLLDRGVFYEQGKSEPMTEIRGVSFALEHTTTEDFSVMALTDVCLQKTSASDGRKTGLYAELDSSAKHETFGDTQAVVAGNEISFETKNAGETSVFYRSLLAEDGTGSINLDSIKDEVYLTADVALSGDASAEDYYMILASDPRGENGSKSSASGVSLSKYLKGGKVKIPISAFAEKEFVNDNPRYSKLDSFRISGAGLAFVPGKAKTGKVNLGDIRFVSDVKSPSNLKLEKMESGAITLSWTPSTNTIKQYELYRGNTLIATLPDGTSTYTDRGLTNDRTYSYRLKTKTMFDTYTSELFLNDIYLSAVGKPARLEAVNIGGDSLSVQLNWEPAEYGDPAGYVILRNGNEIASVAGDVLTYIDNQDLTDNATYIYAVRSKASDGSLSYSQESEVMVAYTYPPQNLIFEMEKGKLTWSGDANAADYEIYLDEKLAAVSDKPEFVFSSEFGYNRIYAFQVVARTAGGNRSMPSETMYAYAFNPAMERSKEFYSDQLEQGVRAKNVNVVAELDNNEFTMMGEKAAKLSFLPLQKATYTMESDKAIGAESLRVNGSILFAAYVPEETDLSKISVGLSYFPDGTNATVLVAGVPLSDYVKEKGKWTLVEIPVSKLPQRATYIKNAQNYTVDVNWSKVTGITFVRENSNREENDVIYVDEVFTASYGTQSATLVDERGENLGGSTLLKTNAEFFSLQTESGFAENALENSTVSLKNAKGEDVFALLSVEKSGQLKISPLSKLEAETEYTFAFAGLKDKHGVPVAGNCVFSTNADVPVEKEPAVLDVLKITANDASVGGAVNASVSTKDWNIIPADGGACTLEINFDSKKLSVTKSAVDVSDKNAEVTISGNTINVKGDSLKGNSDIAAARFKALKSGDASISVSGKYEFGGTMITLNEKKTVVSLKNGSSSGGTGSRPGSGGGFGGGRGEGSSVEITSNPEFSEKPQGNQDSKPTVRQKFTDVTTAHWAFEVINELANEKIINGYEDGSFRPENVVSREEFALLLTTLMGLESEGKAKFTDVPADAWYAKAIAAANAYEIIQGKDDGSFGVGEPISREDMCVMVQRMAKKFSFGLKEDFNTIIFSDGENISEYAKEMVYALQKSGIVNGYEDGSFRPLGSVTRAEAAKVISSLLPYAKTVRLDKKPSVEQETPAGKPEKPQEKDLAYDQARNRLKAFAIHVPKGDGDAVIRDEFLRGIAGTFGGSDSADAGRVWAESTGLVGEGEYNGTENISYGEAIQVILNASGMKLVIEGNGGGKEGAFKVARILGLTKGIDTGLDDLLSGRDACLLLSNFLEAETVSSTFGEESVSMSGRDSVLEKFLKIEKKFVKVEEINKKERQINVSEDGKEKMYSTVPGFNFDSIAPVKCTIYIDQNGLVCYSEIAAGTAEILYDYIEEVNGSPDKETFYYPGGVSRLKFFNSEKDYRVASDAVFICNEKPLESGEAFQFADCFVRTVVVNNTVVYADVYRLNEGGLIYAVTDEFIKFRHRDKMENSMRDLDMVENLTVILDGNRVGGMELLDEEMVFDYWQDEEEDNMVIAASSRSAYGEFSSNTDEELRIAGKRYLKSDNINYYNSYLKRYETGGDGYREYLGQMVYAYLDDRSQVRYVEPDEINKSKNVIYGVVSGVSENGVFSKESKVKFFQVSSSGSGNGEVIYPVAEKLAEGSLSVEYVKSVQQNLDGKGFLKFTLNSNDEIIKMEIPNNFGRTVTVNSNEFRFDENNYYFSGLFLRFATVIVPYMGEDGFTVATTDYETLRDMEFSSMSSDIFMTVDYEPTENPLPEFAVLTGKVEKIMKEEQIWSSFINDIAYTEDGYDVTFGSNVHHMSEEIVEANGLKPGMLVEAEIHPYMAEQYQIRRIIDLSVPLDEWKGVLEGAYGSYSNEKTYGLFAADKVLMCSQEFMQFEVDGQPTDVLGLGLVSTVYKISERGGKRTIKQVTSNIANPVWFQTKQVLTNLDTNDKIWFRLTTDNGYRYVSGIYYYED